MVFRYLGGPSPLICFFSSFFLFGISLMYRVVSFFLFGYMIPLLL